MIKTPCFDWNDTLKAAKAVGFIHPFASSDDIEERAQFAAALGAHIWDTYEDATPKEVSAWYVRDVACAAIGEWFFTSDDGGIRAELAIKHQGESIPADELWSVVNDKAA